VLHAHRICYAEAALLILLPKKIFVFVQMAMGFQMMEIVSYFLIIVKLAMGCYLYMVRLVKCVRNVGSKTVNSAAK